MSGTLSDDELLNRLSTDEDSLPLTTVKEILGRGDRLAPALVRLVEDRRCWETAPPASAAPIHASFILALLQPPGAADVLLRAVRTAVDLEEMFIIDHADLILATCGPALMDPLIAIARNADEPFNLRMAANEAVARIALAHPPVWKQGRDHLVAFATNRNEDHELRDIAADAVVEFATPDDEPILRDLEREELVHEEIVEEALGGRYEGFYRRAVDLLQFYEPEAIAQRKRFFEEFGVPEESIDEEPDFEPPPSLEVLSRLDEPSAGPAPIVNAEPKVGRNDPCPCGSGRKFKKCCG